MFSGFSLSRVCNVFSFGKEEEVPSKEELGAEYAKRALRGEEAARALGLTDDQQAFQNGVPPGAAPPGEAQALDGEEEFEEEDEDEEESNELEEGLVDAEGHEDLYRGDEGGPAEGGHADEGHNDGAVETPRTPGMLGQLLEKARHS